MTSFRRWPILLAAGIAVLLALAVWRAASRGATEGPPSEPVALITVAPARAQSVAETTRAFGLVAGAAGATRTLVAPRPVIVTAVRIAPGQAVEAGAALVEIASTPAAALAYRQAVDAAAFAQKDVDRVQRLFDARLAAADQLSAARKTLADARAALAAQGAAGGASGHQILLAPVSGVVGTVPVTPGEQVAADAPLVTLVATGRLVAQLGVEPEKAARLAPGMAAMISPAFDRTWRVASRVSLVGHSIDPVTRLATISVPVSDPRLPLGAAIAAEITLSTHAGLLAPRAAVIFDESGSHVFVVAAGKVRQVAVTAGPEQGGEIEISGPVKAGDQLAVDGAYELTDGARVRVAHQ